MSDLLTPTHSRRVSHFVGFCKWRDHPGGVEMEFAVDGPISFFDADKLPRMFECVEIVGVVWTDEPPPA